MTISPEFNHFFITDSETLTKGYQCVWSCQTLESSFGAAGGVASMQSCRCHLCGLVKGIERYLGILSSTFRLQPKVNSTISACSRHGSDVDSVHDFTSMFLCPGLPIGKWLWHCWIGMCRPQLGHILSPAGHACDIIMPNLFRDLCMLLCMNWQLATQ